MSTLSDAFVPLIPRPMTLPSCTKTQPTGVSSEARASSAISMALRMKPSWYSRLGTGSKTVRFAIFLGLARSGYWRVRLPSMQHSVPWWRGWGCAINAGSTFRRRPVHRLRNFVWKARVGGDVRASEWKARRTCRSHYKNYVHVPTSLRPRQVRGAFRRRTMCIYIWPLEHGRDGGRTGTAFRIGGFASSAFERCGISPGPRHGGRGRGPAESAAMGIARNGAMPILNGLIDPYLLHKIQPSEAVTKALSWPSRTIEP